MSRATLTDLAELLSRNPDLRVSSPKDVFARPALASRPFDAPSKPSVALNSGSTSELEALFAALGFPAPETEFRFHPTRRWRFDYAWPSVKVAFEVEGGTWANGRHTRGKGYRADCQKYSEAAILGWKVVRATTDMVQDGGALDLIQRALKSQHEYICVKCHFRQDPPQGDPPF